MSEKYQEIDTAEIGSITRTAGIWHSLTALVRTGLHLITTIVLARLLMPADFGIVAIALMFTGFATIFHQLGLGRALVQRKEINDDHKKAAFWGTLLIGVILFGLAILIAPYLGVYFNEPRVVPVVKIISLSLIISPLSVVPRAMFQRVLDFRRPFFAALACGITYSVVGITMAMMGKSYWSLVFAQLLSVSVESIVFCVVNNYVPPLIPSFRRFRDLYSFGAGVTTIGLFEYIAQKIDYFVIGRRLEPSSLGLYERAFQLMTIPLMVPWLLSVVLFPALSKMQDDLERVHNAFKHIQTVTTILTWPTYIILLVTAPEFVLLVLGEQWTASVTSLRILILVGIIRSIDFVARTATKSMGVAYVWGEAWRLCIYAILLGSGAWIGTRWGIVGVSWAATIASFLLLILSVHLLRSAIGFGFRECMKTTLVPLVITALVGGATQIVRYFLLSTGISLWFVLFGSTMVGLVVMVTTVAFIPEQSLVRVRSEVELLLRRVIPSTNL